MYFLTLIVDLLANLQRRLNRQMNNENLKFTFIYAIDVSKIHGTWMPRSRSFQNSICNMYQDNYGSIIRTKFIHTVNEKEKYATFQINGQHIDAMW